MLRLIVAVVAVATVWGQIAEPQPDCRCTPPQWEGIQGGQGGFVAGGKPQILTTVSWVAFDRTNKRVFLYTNTTAGPSVTSFKVYQDFKSGYQFTYDVKTKTCSKTKLQQPFNKGCLPENAKFMGYFDIGLGSEQLKAKSYTVHMTSPGTVIDVALTVTAKQCIPIGENFVGSSNNVPMAVGIGFVNISSGIKDPSIFNPPSICDKNTTMEFPPTHVPPEYRIFHL